MDRERLQRALDAVAGFLVADAPLGDTLQRIAHVTSEAVPGADAVGITLVAEPGRAAPVAATSSSATALDAAQFDDDAGPSVLALRKNELVALDDIEVDVDRWPAFARAAQEHGIRSIVAVPLAAGDEPPFGTVSCYARTTLHLAPPVIEEATLIASYASAALSNAKAYWGAFDLAKGLEEAMRSRATIEQAKGKIMAADGCTPDEAFQILVLASQRQNVKLRDVAASVVAAKLQRP